MQPFYEYIEKAIRWAQKESGVKSIDGKEVSRIEVSGEKAKELGE